MRRNKPYGGTKLTLTAILSVLSLCGFGQINPQFTHYGFNQFFLNPAAAGNSGTMDVTALYRTQWTGYNGTFDQGGAPVSQIISVNTPLSFLSGGVGLVIMNDQIGGGGINRSIKGSYAYRKRFGPSTFSAGIAVGSYSRVLDGTQYRPREQDDPVIPNTRIGDTQLDVDLGVMLSNPGYQLGVSVKHINQPSFVFGPEGASPLPRILNVHGNITVGLSYTLDVIPMFQVKSDFNTVSTEAGALFKYNSKYWAGANYRWQDAASFLIGGTFLNNSLSVGYALDYVVFGTNAKAPLSHEIFVSYALKPPKGGRKSIIRTPRYGF